MRLHNIIVLLALLALVMVLIGSFKRQEKEINIPVQNIHVVRCIDGDGNLDTYHINVPLEVIDLEVYSKGFCDSL